MSGLVAQSLRLTGERVPLKEIYECPVVSTLQLLGFVMGYRDSNSRSPVTELIELTALSSPVAPWVVTTTTCDATGDGRPRALFFALLKTKFLRALFMC